jgi:hypothetical protein
MTAATTICLTLRPNIYQISRRLPPGVSSPSGWKRSQGGGALRRVWRWRRNVCFYDTLLELSGTMSQQIVSWMISSSDQAGSNPILSYLI